MTVTPSTKSVPDSWYLGNLIAIRFHLYHKKVSLNSDRGRFYFTILLGFTIKENDALNYYELFLIKRSPYFWKSSIGCICTVQSGYFELSK